MIRAAPAAALRGRVTQYWGFRETTDRPTQRREGPGNDVIVVVSFGHEWMIDGERLHSFAAGLHEQQVTTEHAGHSHGMQIDLAPQTAYALFGEPMHMLAGKRVPLEDVLDEPALVEQLCELEEWPARFALLDRVLGRRLESVPSPSAEIAWAWKRLLRSGGCERIASVAMELGWSRKRIIARFREEVGLAPKSAARLIRFERAKATVEQADAPDWARIAVDCGYYDQSHMINDFRRVTGRTPETFFQDEVVAQA